LMTEMPHFSNAQKTDLSNAMYLRDHLVNIPSSYRKQT
jgi:hypothetical protein